MLVQSQLEGDGSLTKVLEHEREQHRRARVEAINTLAGGIAHDLNNALTPVLVSIELLREEAPHLEDLLSNMSAGATRAARTVNLLLDYARGSHGRHDVIDPATLIATLGGTIRSRVGKTIEVITGCEAGTPRIIGDSSQITQMLLNLCTNAQEAMPDGGTLRVLARAVTICDAANESCLVGVVLPGRYAAFEVSDSGDGIPPAIIDRILEPFFTTRGRERHTGLGLALVVGVVKGHRGFLRVDSPAGSGATFTVCLPALETRVTSPATATAAMPA